MTHLDARAFGVKDILSLQIVNEGLQVHNNECELTFKDKINVTCKLTLDEIFDIYMHNAFKGALIDNSFSLQHHINEWYRKKRNHLIPYKDAKIYDAAEMDAMTDKWIDMYHKKGVKATKETEIVAAALSKQKEALRKSSMAGN